MESNLYKLIVSLSLKDTTKGGFAQIQKNANAVGKQTKELQASLDKFRKNIGVFKTAQEGQEKLNGLAKQEVSIREKLALAKSADEKRGYQAQVKAVGLVKMETQARIKDLQFQEKATSQRLSDFRQFEELDRRARRDAEAFRRQQLRDEKMLAEQQMRDAHEVEAAQQGRGLGGIRGIIGGSGLGLAGGIAAGAASSGIMGGLRTGLTGATDMQTALTTLQISTSASASEMEGLRGLAFDIANNTGQSATQAAQNLAILAGSGLNDPKQLRSLAKPIAQFADVQFYKNHTSFEDSAKQGVQLAHLFGAYSSDKMKPILEKLTQVSFAMPDNLNRFLTQAGYYEPVFRGLGVSDADSIQAGAIIDRAGLGRGKGGSALQNMLLNQMNALAMTGHVQGKRKGALIELGLADSSGSSNFYKWNAKDHKNEFDIIGALKQIDKSVNKLPEGMTGRDATKWQMKRLGELNAALGLTGERAALAITPEALSNLDDALKRISKSGNMSQIQGTYMGTLGAQQQRFKSNMDSLLTDLMWPWLNDLRKGFSWMGDEAHTMQAWAHTHREAAKEITGGLLGIGAALAVYSGAQMWGIATGLIGLSKAIRMLGAQSAVAGAEVATAEAEVGAGALGLSGVLTKIGPLLGYVAVAEASLKSIDMYKNDTAFSSHNENAQANLAQAYWKNHKATGPWWNPHAGGPSFEPDGHGGEIVVKGDIHLHVPAGTTQQQLHAIASGLKNHRNISNHAHPVAPPPGMNRHSLR